MSRPELRLRTRTLAANIRAVQQRISPSEVMIVLKDDAYGHGTTWVVETAENVGVRWFGAYDVRSALDVRRMTTGDTRVFAWATSTADEVDQALLQGIDLGVGTTDYLERVITRAQHLGTRGRVHLKIDTGLHRNGLLPSEWQSALTTARSAEEAGYLSLVGVWSHLAEASDAEDDDAQQVFLEAVRSADDSGAQLEVAHLTASAASWWRPELRGSLSRIGAFCYGVRSADGADLDGIVPVAELVAEVVDIRDGDAIIGLGAFDGIPSTLAGVDVGVPGGVRALLSVDDMTSRIAGWPGVAVGDSVWVFGSGEHGESSATALAESIDTVGEEILTRLTARVRRLIVD